MKGDPNEDTATDHIRMAIADLVLDELNEGRDLVSSERPTTRIYEVLYRLSWAIGEIERADNVTVLKSA